MDNANFPNSINPRPKRRKSKDNPYELFSIGTNPGEITYWVRFIDGSQVEHCIEIQEDIFQELDAFELEDLSQLNEWDRHIEQSHQYETSLVINAVEDPVPMEEAFFDRAEIEMLRKVISTLPEIHRRRIILYFYKHLTYEKIAAQEGCSKVAVKYTLALSIEELRKKIKKFLQET